MFDRAIGLDRKMVKTWEERQKEGSDFRNYYEYRISAIWHNINHVFVAFKRKRYWQAISDIEEIRKQTITRHGLRKDL